MAWFQDFVDAVGGKTDRSVTTTTTEPVKTGMSTGAKWGIGIAVVVVIIVIVAIIVRRNRKKKAQ